MIERLFFLHRWRWLCVGAALACSSCRAPEPQAPTAPPIVTILSPDGTHVSQGALVSKKLRGAGVPRFYMATKRSALAEMPGDTILMNGGGIAQTTQVLEDGGGPLWRGQESPDAAMLPIRLPQGENDKPVPLESLQDGAPGLPAPVADLARLADQVPLR